MIYELKYYVSVNINGVPKYLHKNNASYDLCNKPESALKFNSSQQAQKAISKITGSFSGLKQFMRPCTDNDILDSYANAKSKLCPDHKFSDKDYHFEQIEAQYDMLEKQLEECDAECMDIAHYMELRELDVQRGYKAYKMMHEARLRRRKVKDEMLILENVKKMIASTEEALQKRKYEPRIRTDIQYEKENQ